MSIADKPTLNLFTGEQNLGTIYKEQHQITPKFWELNIPGTDSSGLQAINYGGNTKIIMLQGAHDGNGFSGLTPNQQIAQFIYVVESWVNTALGQDEYNYTDSTGTTIRVNCFDFTWIRSFENPAQILYSFLFKQV